MATATALLPLHPGKAPRWLFERMVELAHCITGIVIDEYGRDGLMNRLSDPWFFQSLACVLGYDWHSSGTTTVTCGALKEAVDPTETGLAIAGGLTPAAGTDTIALTVEAAGGANQPTGAPVIVGKLPNAVALGGSTSIQ